jgi:hypothetical protein
MKVFFFKTKDAKQFVFVTLLALSFTTAHAQTAQQIQEYQAQSAPTPISAAMYLNMAKINMARPGVATADLQQQISALEQQQKQQQDQNVQQLLDQAKQLLEKKQDNQ